jgi:hypothetical protein
MGVELRIHTFFILLLGVCMAYTESTHMSVFRGVGLWLVLLGAVAVREVARMIVAAYHGLQLRNILLRLGGLRQRGERGECRRQQSTVAHGRDRARG